MFRLFKKAKNLNWRYIIGEILLIFIGINLAIWFNNWNESKKVVRGKRIAIERVTEEIQNNSKELEIALNVYSQLFNADADYSNFYNGSRSQILARPEEAIALRNKHPNFFLISDSTHHENGIYQYNGKTMIELELPSLTKIAWETTTATNLSAELDFDCLYNLESMYDLQRMIQIEINKAANALQKREIDGLMNILRFIHQLGLQLQEDYAIMHQSIKDCQ
ncbi:MAG: hypothetical protein MI974_21735 [Chitinophagales bacterium]|nr:hypothetical protein [Chitinophagales bacterium]